MGSPVTTCPVLQLSPVSPIVWNTNILQTIFWQPNTCLYLVPKRNKFCSGNHISMNWTNILNPLHPWYRPTREYILGGGSNGRLDKISKEKKNPPPIVERPPLHRSREHTLAVSIKNRATFYHAYANDFLKKILIWPTYWTDIIILLDYKWLPKILTYNLYK